MNRATEAWLLSLAKNGRVNTPAILEATRWQGPTRSEVEAAFLDLELSGRLVRDGGGHRVVTVAG
jgi:hypothetical protein